MNDATRQLFINAGRMVADQLADALDDQVGYAVEYLRATRPEGSAELELLTWEDEPEDATQAELNEFEDRLMAQHEAAFVGFIAEFTGRDVEDVERFLNETR